jgi:hypothetical protein
MVAGKVHLSSWAGLDGFRQIFLREGPVIVYVVDPDYFVVDRIVELSLLE